MSLSSLFESFLSICYPRLCVGCGRVLIEKEPYFCIDCIQHFPKIKYLPDKENRTRECFYGRFPIGRAASFLEYNKRGLARKIVRRIKYSHDRELGEFMGRWMGRDFQLCNFFEGIDGIVPVPLHPRRERKRGFNQAEAIARGISAVTGIPVVADQLVRTVANPSQTKKGVYERWQNTEGIFRLKAGEGFPYRNIVLVDDVLTTGATLLACALCFEGIEELNVNILTLAIA